MLIEKIVKKSDGYYVQSEEGKNLGGPYKKIEDAERRLGQVEYFKNKDKRKSVGESTENEADKQYYVVTHSKDRVGNKNRRYRVVDASSKADVRRKLSGGFYGTIDIVLTKEEALSKFGEDNFKKLWNINLVDESLTEDKKMSYWEWHNISQKDPKNIFNTGVDSSKEFSYNKSGKRGKVMVNESLIADKIEDMVSADDVKVALEAEYADYPHVLEGLLEWIGDGEDFEEYRENLVNLLNEIEYLESTDQMDALEMATEDQGSSYFEDTVDIINRGDFIFFPGVEDDEELGHAFVDMCGGISAAVGRDRLATYIDIDLVAETFKEGMEDDPDLADMDDDAWYSLAEEQVEMSPESYENYFDYDQYGRDLHMEGGYFFGDLGAIAIL